MFEQVADFFYWAIGSEQDYAKLTTLQMILRTVIVYGVALALIRIGKRRFLGGYTAFDILMGFVVGSIMSRTITGREDFFSAILVIATLMAIHYVISYITYYSSNASEVLKNSDRQLIKNGELDRQAMQDSKLGDNDLLQAMRQKGSVQKIEEVEAAFLERDGSITVIPKKSDPKVLEVEVEEGVQTVKIIVS
ncbi:MAG: DUF421 domain-containing protein [Acidobacteriota bacterium]|jgi:uncharacterized membrane protein YcaP (DUF421 family)|nr:DUF421 domain-containing protein [Acidobacteriota bacterium]